MAMAKRGSLTVLLISAVVTLALPHVPIASYLVRPLVWLSTLAHELGHGVTAELVGGDFHRFEMSSNGAGFAVTSSSNRLQRAAISAGGLIGPAITSMFLFAMGRRERWARVGLGLLAAFYGLALLLVVRNLFGMVFVGLLVAALVAVLKWGNAAVAQFSLVFLAVNLAVSVFTRGDYLFTEFAGAGRPSDVAHMATALLLPYWFWGAVCGLLSVVALGAGLWLYLREGKSAASSKRSSSS